MKTERKTGSNKNWFFNFIVLSAIALGIIVFLIQFTSKNPTSSTPITNSATGQQIYTNTKYGFSFEYPAGSKIVLPTPDDVKYNEDKVDMLIPEKTRDITLANDSGTIFHILILPNETQTIAEIKNQPSEAGAPKRINLTDTTVDNSPAIKYNFDCTGFTGCDAGPNVTTIHNKIRYIFTFFDEKASNQVLSTFKFTK